MKKILLALFLSAIFAGVISAAEAAWFSKKFPAELINASGKKVKTEQALQGKIVAVYFSASWCGPCRGFTPQLVNFYKRAAKKNNLEIVFISSDKTADAMMQYMKKDKMPWLAVPQDSPLAKALQRELKVNGIPTLVVFDQNGKVISTNARWDVVKLGAKAPAAWKSSNYKPLTYQDVTQNSKSKRKSKRKNK